MIRQHFYASDYLLTDRMAAEHLTTSFAEALDLNLSPRPVSDIPWAGEGELLAWPMLNDHPTDYVLEVSAVAMPTLRGGARFETIYTVSSVPEDDGDPESAPADSDIHEYDLLSEAFGALVALSVASEVRHVLDRAAEKE